MKVYELILSLISTLSTTAIPIVLAILGYKENKRKENRSIETDRKEKLQHYYQNVVIPLLKELEYINQCRQDRRILLCEKLVLNTSPQYKNALSIEYEEYTRIEYLKMVSIIGKILKTIRNFKKEVVVFGNTYNEVIKNLERILEITMSIDINYFLDRMVNAKVTELMIIFTGHVSILLQIIESTIIYEIYDVELELNILHDMDSIMQEFLKSIHEVRD